VSVGATIGSTAGGIASAAVDTRIGDRIIRFDRAERWLHWVNGVLVLVLMATGAVLYFGPLSAVVGRRTLMKDIHVWSGLFLVVPIAAVLAGRWRTGLLRDAARVSRWTGDDRLWIRSRGRSSSLRLGKFNAGQKLNSLFMAGILPVLLMTGSIMKWFGPFPDSMRTGATFVHDVSTFGVWIAVTGHLVKAVSEPVAMRSMVSGWVPESWARRHRPRWHSDVVGAPAEPVAEP